MASLSLVLIYATLVMTSAIDEDNSGFHHLPQASLTLWVVEAFYCFSVRV